MTAQLWTDPFADEIERPPRDRFGRPCLVPRGGGERVAYTRMSTLAGYLTDSSSLGVWQKRLLAVGLSQREDIAAMIAGLPPLHDLKTDKALLTREQKRQDKDTKAQLDAHIDAALEHAGQHIKANQGTARHSFFESGDTDAAPALVKADVDAALAHFERHGIQVLARETFVVNDELQAAGRFDFIAHVPTLGTVVGDLKTGQIDGKGLHFAVQLAGYATSEVYDLDTDERYPLEALTGGAKVSRTYALLVHMPLGHARCDLHQVNIATGLHAARLATRVRAARQINDLCAPLIFKDEEEQ